MRSSLITFFTWLLEYLLAAIQTVLRQPPVSEVYTDRNQAAMLAARLAALQGWHIGIAADSQNPDPLWPILFIDTPAGQVSWHVPVGELYGDWPDYNAPWDGHTIAEKQRRLVTLLWTLSRQDVQWGHDAAGHLTAQWKQEPPQ